ncbi:MAG TPA: GNAT family N-acetyltransferase [Candidatus Binataceae bacterium]|nr:GNAT family N-acetyltransferase [Candidatus Binataceae bacterium]
MSDTCGATAPARRGPVFTEKAFYLEEFYGKSLLFTLIPPSGERLSELDALVRTLRELKRNSTRCILIASTAALPRILRRLGRLAPRGEIPTFNPARGLRTRPYPPDSAITQIWSGLRSGAIVIAAVDSGDAADLVVFARELAARLRVFKLILLDRGGGLDNGDGARLPFVEIKRLRRVLAGETSPLRRALVRAAGHALRDGVPSVNLTAPREVYDELFSFIGAGTLFTEHQYGDVRPIAIDDFEEAATLIKRGQKEGSLLPRDDDEIARLLPSCFGYRVGDENLAGIVSLLTEPYRRERAGEITGLYTLTRFQREGVAQELVGEVVAEARARRLRYVFACTAEANAARFFARLKFRRVTASATPAAKWRGYDRTRIPRLLIFRQDLK